MKVLLMKTCNDTYEDEIIITMAVLTIILWWPDWKWPGGIDCDSVK